MADTRRKKRHRPRPVHRKQHTPSQIRHRIDDLAHALYKPAAKTLALVTGEHVDVSDVDKGRVVCDESGDADELGLCVGLVWLVGRVIEAETHGVLNQLFQDIERQ